jgi:hypothetical protein
MQEKTKKNKKEDEAKVRDIKPEKDAKGGGGGGTLGGGGTHGAGDHTTGPLSNK